MNGYHHVPVLLEEALQALQVKEDGVYVDATYGRGGHAQEILKKIGERGRLLAFDRDPHACEDARRRFGNDARVQIHQGPYSMLGQAIESQGLAGGINGILFDLGVSSPQIEDTLRGFSFRAEGPLDMRMDPRAGESAAEWINRAEENEIVRVLRDYGEERFAKRIARAILRERSIEPIATTRRLAEIVARAVPAREKSKDPATRTFQAIRIHINRELEELTEALPQAVKALTAGGRLAVISFHSLEDRVVKHFLRVEAKGRELPPELPVRHDQFRARLKIVGKATRASEAEISRNPRARSAVLRVAERTAEDGIHA
ncbi:MAG: 16S rRNA (cytosine(1402)-N(4))-methyltransferase [Candidatus Muproteobacteria bacterium RIFCSPHIGHO2_12_FULL_60_33]|uniref:Ribosomal RNA small subunit methyltransferase H n=1 Tax=Candidatus Muproteobacteria bacterium RIFCSPLOWO2_01_FULL_60_18 TaxID=1817768 RepID=A0A1F6U5S3_9PROT|nr:MAG: 16S rRNA (cytosine(1402)-N(4))-methyltransferase [Candidatus Muproteobacteria bacterium RIFCSPLOWO2_01_FULL_60_18]OGI53265.1 MAG: 16S rRNA (cytosine(1402)-N(4))-methyltransferase [Candidatus Muproteobacteria bacterium RIFCSPHIGHO2_01_60_12]OGI53889.1 MAG: 16S rRNA (cytosine(1402)-N(4))-methyltransferase [Candidatus Muproteobacteria bacterium RIFCSPHIGHO2_02_FULL_60_13]OGI56320.1 MAG: 16S rRNA (cytosine(1402)-N(4))-methyltransferase [Candidatus Muproteobacteria bacterium RIFCSPHIGHO2_12_F